MANSPFTTLTIANVVGTGTFNLLGNLTNLRINNKTSLYSSNFTPTFPLTSISGTSLLLLTQPNAPYADSSENNATVNLVGSTNPSFSSLSPSSYST